MKCSKSLKYVSRGLLALVSFLLLSVIIVLVTGLVLLKSADYREPEMKIDRNDYPLSLKTDSLRICGDNYLLCHPSGLWEGYVSGIPKERGAVLGVLGEDLIYHQEKVFVDQIREFVPSDFYLGFLRALIEIFNRHMAENIPEEYLEEIYAMSLFATHEYDVFGNPYERQLNYHAAHDIGHALQEYMLVGCSSFGVWNESSADGALLLGRNFDFYVGEAFAKNKVVLFMEPENGFRFASVTWPGMIGVVSGMNEKGLTVTINAAKGPIPLSSAMPVSLLVRQILQYASNIDEAYQIAAAFPTFVSEAIMVGSAEDGRVSIIEKTPEVIDLYAPENVSRVICTNHYQGKALSDEAYNLENLAVSDSRYRYERLNELVREKLPLSVEDAAAILRDRWGKAGEDVGLGNEMTVNQSIAHHSVIFQPEELKMWVSTSPWQSGPMLCYDLNEIFRGDGTSFSSHAIDSLSLPADTLFMENDYSRVMAYRDFCTFVKSSGPEFIGVDEEMIRGFLRINPDYFETYEIAGDYYLSRGEQERAVRYWQTALGKALPRMTYRDRITEKIERYDKK